MSLTQKAWVFYFDGSQWNVWLPHTYEKRDWTGRASRISRRLTGGQAAGRPYVSATLETLGPGTGYQKQSKQLMPLVEAGWLRKHAEAPLRFRRLGLKEASMRPTV